MDKEYLKEEEEFYSQADNGTCACGDESEKGYCPLESEIGKRDIFCNCCSSCKNECALNI